MRAGADDSTSDPSPRQHLPCPEHRRQRTRHDLGGAHRRYVVLTTVSPVGAGWAGPFTKHGTMVSGFVAVARVSAVPRAQDGQRLALRHDSRTFFQVPW